MRLLRGQTNGNNAKQLTIWLVVLPHQPQRISTEAAGCLEEFTHRAEKTLE